MPADSDTTETTHSSTVPLRKNLLGQELDSGMEEFYTSPLTFTWSEIDIPFECPSYGCLHAVPANLPYSIVEQFRDAARLVHDEGHDAKGLSFKQMQICMSIANFRRTDHTRRVAEARGYRSLDLVAIAPTVIAMKTELDALVFEPTAKESCHVWNNLLEDLAGGNPKADPLRDLTRFEKGKNSSGFFEIEQAARPGE